MMSEQEIFEIADQIIDKALKSDLDLETEEDLRSKIEEHLQENRLAISDGVIASITDEIKQLTQL